MLEFGAEDRCVIKNHAIIGAPAMLARKTTDQSLAMLPNVRKSRLRMAGITGVSVFSVKSCCLTSDDGYKSKGVAQLFNQGDAIPYQVSSGGELLRRAEKSSWRALPLNRTRLKRPRNA
jgi:hypothetical protein